MRRMRLREWLVCLKVTVSDDQLITPMTAISCWLVMVLCPFQPTAWLPCQLAVAIRYCEQGEWVYSHAIRSRWVSQQDASVGINMWQETNGFRCKALHLFSGWIYRDLDTCTKSVAQRSYPKIHLPYRAKICGAKGKNFLKSDQNFATE